MSIYTPKKYPQDTYQQRFIKASDALVRSADPDVDHNTVFLIKGDSFTEKVHGLIPDIKGLQPPYLLRKSIKFTYGFLQYDTSKLPRLNFGTDKDFTIEYVVSYTDCQAQAQIFSNGNPSTGLITGPILAANRREYNTPVIYNGSSWRLGSTSLKSYVQTPNIGSTKFVHLAWVRHGHTHYLYLDGKCVVTRQESDTSDISVNLSRQPNTDKPLSVYLGMAEVLIDYIDTPADIGRAFNGQLTFLRISDSARYLQEFDPKTEHPAWYDSGFFPPADNPILSLPLSERVPYTSDGRFYCWDTDSDYEPVFGVVDGKNCYTNRETQGSTTRYNTTYCLMDGTGLPTGDSDRTISLWYHWDGNTNNTSSYYPVVIFGYGARASRYFCGIEIQKSGESAALIFSSYNYNTRTQYGKAPLNEWVHVCCVHKNGRDLIYINGVAQLVGVNSDGTTTEVDNKRDTRTGWLKLAGVVNEGYSYRYSGSLRNVQVFNKALTDAEITALYNEG